MMCFVYVAYTVRRMHLCRQTPDGFFIKILHWEAMGLLPSQSTLAYHRKQLYQINSA